MKKLNEYILEKNINDDLNNLLSEIYIKEPINKSVKLNDRLVKRCAGYIVEQYIKYSLRIPEADDGKFNEFYDFKKGNDLFEIKAYQQGKLIGNVHFTEKQIKKLPELTIIFVEYKVDSTNITINKIYFKDGNKIEVDKKYNRLTGFKESE